MQIDLRPDLFGAVWCRDLLLFDAQQGDYQLIAGAAHAAGISGAGSRLVVENEDFVRFLSEEGLLLERPCARAASRSPPPLPRTSALSTASEPIPAHRWAIVRAYLEMALLYVGRPLPILLRTARSKRRGVRYDAVALARSFHQLSPWLPLQGVCVFRSYLLMRLLSRAGAEDARWVFGVRAWPFHAHCWIQQGDVALTDYAESLVQYAPIFAL